MKLEIGNDDKREGWVTLDVYGNPNVLADAFQTLPFADGSFDELYSSHVIEHGGWDVVPNILKEWGRVIRQGGTMHIKCPDFEYHVKMYQEDNGRLYEQGGLMYGLYGHQIRPALWHRAALDKRWLGEFLDKAGFTPQQWDNSNPWELNVRAVKR